MNQTYQTFAADFQNELCPEGILEQTFVNEIAAAAWRLHLCAEDETEKAQSTRAKAMLILTRSTRELRLLQTERQLRTQLATAGEDTSKLGLASYKEILAARSKRPQPAPQTDLASFCKTPQGPAAPVRQIARTSLCPCNSGRKYKKCCGVNAPPVLGRAA